MADDRVASTVRARLADYEDLAHAVVTSSELTEQVVEVGRLLLETYVSGGRLLVFGNGGSAADAQHLAAEFVGRCTIEREPMSALALADNLATVTAIGNDFGYDQVFARQLQAHGRAGDVALALSTSGRSPNIVRGLDEARRLGLRTVVLTGGSGADLEADVVLRVPSQHTGRIQEIHMMWCHVWVETVERALAARA